MIEENIRAVKEAEDKAAAILADARAEAVRIAAQAEADAAAILAGAEKEAKEAGDALGNIPVEIFGSLAAAE